VVVAEMLRRAVALGGGGWRWKDALGACTESLGSETGDVGGDPEIDQQLGHQHAADEEAPAEQQAVPPPEKKKRLLPPPMPRAATSMRAERRGGRLILTEEPLEQHRLDVLHAERTGGRLRMQLTPAAGFFGREAPDGEPPAAGADVVVGDCGNDAGELCQVAEAGGAVMGT
jgi:hypothetical protein